MKSKVFTVTASQLNSLGEVEVEPILTVGSYLSGNETFVENKIYYPTDVILENLTGITISMIVLNDEREEIFYTENPQFFDFIPIRNSEGFSFTFTNRVSKIILKKDISDLAISNFNIYCMGYKIV